jgi:hypothetical protein
MPKSKVFLAFVSIILTIVFSSSCNRIPSVSVGNYYLDGESTTEYIKIMKENQLLLHGFDINALVEHLNSGIGLEGNALNDFWTEQGIQDLHYTYSNILDFEVADTGLNDYKLYVLPESYLGYCISIEDANTLLFDGNRYIRP